MLRERLCCSLLQREKSNEAAHSERHTAAHEGHRAIAARIPSHLAIPKPFSIPPNETAIKEKEFGSNLLRIWVEKILKNPIFFSFAPLPKYE